MLARNATTRDQPRSGPGRFGCATPFHEATLPLSLWKARGYANDSRQGFLDCLWRAAMWR